MRKLSFLLVLMCVISAMNVNAQLSTMIGKVNGGYHFWLYEPENNPSTNDNANKKAGDSSDPNFNPPPTDESGEEYLPIMLDSESAEVQIAKELSENVDSGKKPLVVFLHGRSLCGTDLNRVMKYGTMAAIKRGLEIDAYAIAPQNPGGAWNPDKILAIIDWVAERYPIDTNRVYVLGMSLGGYGTIDFTAAYPDRVAAAIAMCGGGSRRDLSGLNQVPLWILHGTADAAVSVNESRKVKNKMEAAGDTPLLRYEEWPGVDHGTYARMFYHPSTYEWLFKHNLQDRIVDRTITITREDLKNVYRLTRRK